MRLPTVSCPCPFSSFSSSPSSSSSSSSSSDDLPPVDQPLPPGCEARDGRDPLPQPLDGGLRIHRQGEGRGLGGRRNPGRGRGPAFVGIGGSGIAVRSRRGLGRGLGRGRAGRRTAADRADRDGPDGRPGSGRGGILRGHGDEGSLVCGSWVWFGSWGVLYAARGFRGGNQIVPRPQLLAFGPCDVLPCLSLSLSLSLSFCLSPSPSPLQSESLRGRMERGVFGVFRLRLPLWELCM